MSTLHTLAPRVGDAALPQECEMCGGDGFQMETSWRGGWEEEEESEVVCFQCSGRGVVVTLVCGRCGEVDHAHPDAILSDERCCHECGHQAPHYLWLPMREEVHVDRYDQNHTHNTEESA